MQINIEQMSKEEEKRSKRKERDKKTKAKTGRDVVERKSN